MDDELTYAIRLRYRAIREEIESAARRSGRQQDSVRVIVVTKAQPLRVVQAAIAAGVRVLGENYVAEALEKIAATQENGVEWHMIGHLQSRKAEEVVRSFHMLHSLDSAKLASRLDHFCTALGRRLPVLLEFNVSGEQTKFGFPAWQESSWPALRTEVGPITKCPGLLVRGLMTMPPFFEDPERTRPFFQRLKRLQEYLSSEIPGVDWTELSMGTSVDYQAAVEEGATCVRIGTAILGPRPL